jgi:hypothetical protein
MVNMRNSQCNGQASNNHAKQWQQEPTNGAADSHTE